jgi:hypothetical protein
MKKPPTSENVTHDPADAPAEPEIIGSHVLERVSVYESTGRLLISLAATATEHAQRNPDDHEAQGIAAILTAIEIAHRKASNKGALGEQAAAFWHKIEGLAGSAQHFMRKPGRGPRTPEQQANILCSRVLTDLKDDATSQQVAENFVARLHSIAPDIAQHTCVPAHVPLNEWRGTDAEGEAVFAVERVVAKKRDRYDAKAITKGAKAITKAALRALGCPNSTVQNFFRG